MAKTTLSWNQNSTKIEMSLCPYGDSSEVRRYPLQSNGAHPWLAIVQHLSTAGHGKIYEKEVQVES